MEPEDSVAIMARFRMNWPRMPNDALAGWKDFFGQWDVQDVNTGIGQIVGDDYFRKHEPNETDFRRKIEAAARVRLGLGATNPNRSPEEACAICGGYGMVLVPGYRNQETGYFIVTDDIEGARAECHRIAGLTVACRCSVGRYYGGQSNALAEDARAWLTAADVQARAQRHLADWVTGLKESLGAFGEGLAAKMMQTDGDTSLHLVLRKYVESIVSESTRQADEADGKPGRGRKPCVDTGSETVKSLAESLGVQRDEIAAEVAGIGDGVRRKQEEIEAAAQAKGAL